MPPARAGTLAAGFVWRQSRFTNSANGPGAENPFVGARPYNGLLAILLMFNSWDLKDENNTLYEVRNAGSVHRWYVVRDLGAALGETGRFNSLSRRWNRAKRNDIDTFERHTFIEGVEEGFVRFAYQGRQPELVRHRITVDDVRWAADLLGRLSETQWRDAFRAGGYKPALADRFIRKIKDNVAAARQLTTSSNPNVVEPSVSSRDALPAWPAILVDQRRAASTRLLNLSRTFRGAAGDERPRRGWCEMAGHPG